MSEFVLEGTACVAQHSAGDRECEYAETLSSDPLY